MLCLLCFNLVEDSPYTEQDVVLTPDHQPCERCGENRRLVFIPRRNGPRGSPSIGMPCTWGKCPFKR